MGKKARKKKKLNSAEGNTIKNSKKNSVKNKIQNSILKKLYSNEAEGLYALVSFLPFFIASWVSGGIVLANLQAFFVVSIILILKNYAKIILGDKNLIFRKEFFLIILAVNVGLLLYYYNLTSIISSTLLLCLSIVLYYLEKELDNSSPKKIILKCLSTLTRMSIYSLVGMATQLFDQDFIFSFEYMAFGFIPGGILVASSIAKYTQVFLNNSWNKQKNDRPSSLVRLLVLFLIFIPAIPLMLTPFHFFPTPFLLIAIMFGKLIKTVEVYSKTEKADQFVALDLANYSLLMSFLVLGIGIIIRMGVL